MSESTENQKTLQQDEFQRWRDDLTEIANSSGVVSTQTGNLQTSFSYFVLSLPIITLQTKLYLCRRFQTNWKAHFVSDFRSKSSSSSPLLLL